MTPTPRSRRTSDVAIGAYAVFVYLGFVGVLAYAIGFFADLGTPTTIDGRVTTPVPLAVAVDLALVVLFAFQHTVMARPWFKAAVTRVVAPAAERATFVLAASAVLAAVFCWWQPIGATVWRVDGPPALAFRVGYAVGWCVVVGSSFLISHTDLFGLRPAWSRLRGRTYSPPPFTERGLYRVVRHPLMAGFLLVFWSTPVMTAGHLLFAASTTTYLLVGIALEERDLVASVGARYLDYRARVPALVPAPGRPRAARGRRRS